MRLLTVVCVVAGCCAIAHGQLASLQYIGPANTLAGGDINEAGQVAIIYAEGDGWAIDRFTDGIGLERIAAGGGGGGGTPSINDHGQVLFLHGPVGGPFRAMVHTDGIGVQELPAPAGSWLLPEFINNHGHVAQLGNGPWAAGTYTPAMGWE